LILKLCSSNSELVASRTAEFEDNIAICSYTHIYTYIHIYTHVYIHKYTNIYVYVYIHVHMYANIMRRADTFLSKKCKWVDYLFKPTHIILRSIWLLRK